ncbi:right-handed parallel beta-helix repeat-containing protein [Rubinisphaera margarita]|uniref:right-handed parallel beta-helix repeat-containing protein n=1 Tax=Rubinisphaera margarita TaxID=2909586 RepID=UPI001EE868EC|nr:right-handed parallel beta-helix repeat-containing protein [Rubinisphaera margarita]MCG6157516.1 right-handed parallel beta-helix repeat-containing protein [Rubinisphaera margarita]
MQALKLILSWTLLVAVTETVRAEEVEISSLRELAEFASRSDNVVRMKPGVYRYTDYMSRDALASRRKAGDFTFMQFSGDNNRFELTDVTIEVDVSIRGIGRPPVHTNEFIFSGDGNTITGLTITNVEHGLSQGGAVISCTGDGNSFEKVTLHVQGSRPYGYGDLFGKGGYKQSAFQVTGDDTRIIDCELYMKAFGHGFFIQKGAANTLLEGCYVEGVLRSTDEMLAETEGIAVKRKFRTVIKNRDGEYRILPGYMKSLAEDGFRTYDEIPGLVIRNCTAKHMRGGFEIRSKAAAVLENCTAVECERGFWFGYGTVVKNCRGDAKYGPLLFVEGNDARAEVTLLGDDSQMTVHAVATVRGTGHRIHLRSDEAKQREIPIPVMLGYSVPPAGEGMADYAERDTSDVFFHNETRMPVVLGQVTSQCNVRTRGPLIEDQGLDNTVQRLPDE